MTRCAMDWRFPDEASDVDRLCPLGADGHHRGAGPGRPVGANLVNERYKQTAPEQEATLRALQAAGVHVIRAGIPNNDQGIAFAERAFARPAGSAA